MGMFTFYKRLLVRGGGMLGSPISCQETDSTVEKNGEDWFTLVPLKLSPA